MEAGKTVENMDEDGNFPDPTDRASMESNRNSVLRIRDRERKLIFKIQEALQRLDKGEYGICEQCGEGIREGSLSGHSYTGRFTRRTGPTCAPPSARNRQAPSRRASFSGQSTRLAGKRVMFWSPPRTVASSLAS